MFLRSTKLLKVITKKHFIYNALKINPTLPYRIEHWFCIVPKVLSMGKVLVFAISCNNLKNIILKFSLIHKNAKFWRKSWIFLKFLKVPIIKSVLLTLQGIQKITRAKEIAQICAILVHKVSKLDYFYYVKTLFERWPARNLP